MGITIKDIAKMAGVSTSTVSLVISEKGYVSDRTKKKVQNIIDDLNYRPLRTARQLASNRTGNIGFIISDDHLTRSEAFYSRILLGAELEARNYDTYLILSSVGTEMEIPDKMPRFLRGRDVDGVIIAGSISTDLIKYLQKENIPMVMIDYSLPDFKTDSVFMDNRSGMRQIIDHLLGQNIRQIGFIGGSSHHPSIRERFEAYQTFMDNAGLGHISRNNHYHYLVKNEISTETGAEGIRNILKKVPGLEAVIGANDTTAIGCIQELSKMKKKVPGEIAVIGFDNNYYSSITNPPLTTVQVPKIELGVEAVRLLMRRIDNPNQIHQTHVIPVDLVVRKSSKRQS